LDVSNVRVHGVTSPDQREQLQTALGAKLTVDRILGRGGMATVYLAHDPKHNRSVALKVLHPELAATLGPERFRREISLVAKLQHPHILGVYDSGETPGGQLWFTMPFVEGESLRDRLRREHQLSVEDTLRIARDIGGALDYAHRAGFVHRDIKPENILFSGDHALLADFGVARSMDPATEPGDERRHSGETLTHSGFAVGTPAYMSPEQASGERTLDARTDEYALAAVVYEMLAGETPYTASTPQAMIAKMMATKAPSIRIVRRDVAPGIDTAIRKALAATPAARYPTAGAFVAALETGAAQEGQEPRVPLKWLAAAVLAIALLTGGGYYWYTRSSAASGPVMLAVLPFDNVGDSANAYFAEGITDEIRSKLTGLPGLQVIASASSNDYRHTRKSPQEIGHELGVHYLLVGHVQWDRRSGSSGQPRVRVDPELVQVDGVRTPTARWQQSIDAPLVDVFKVQTDIATAVAEQLRITLGAGERATLAQRPTRNMDAYDAFLRGEAYDEEGNGPNSERAAIAAYQEAVHLDSGFAQAWANLAYAHINIYGSGSASTAEEGDSALRDVRRALAIAPDLPDAHSTMSYYYSVVERDFPKALSEARSAHAETNPKLLDQLGYAHERLGQWDSTVASFQTAVQLDPRDPGTLADLGFALMYLRRYAAAKTALDRARALNPGDLTYVEWRVMASLGEGDLDGAQQVLRTVPATVDQTSLVSAIAPERGQEWILDDAQRRHLLTLRQSDFDNDRPTWALTLAQAYGTLGDTRRSRAYADSAVAAYNAMIVKMPATAGGYSGLGVAYAYAGRSADAVSAGEHGVALQPLSRDARVGVIYLHNLARIYTITKQPERAIDVLDTLVSHPGYLSPGWIRIDPTFASLRGNPRFDRITSPHRTDSAGQSSLRRARRVPAPTFAAEERHGGSLRPPEIGDEERDASGAVIQAVRMRGRIGGGDSRGARRERAGAPVPRGVAGRAVSREQRVGQSPQPATDVGEGVGRVFPGAPGGVAG
jgi:serine/threonine protein kinase/tetratricopeptide (TPR) repeat protein